MYVASLAAVEKLRATAGQELLDSVDVTCGLSLGKYTALAFAGTCAPPAVELLAWFAMSVCEQQPMQSCAAANIGIAQRTHHGGPATRCMHAHQH